MPSFAGSTTRLRAGNSSAVFAYDDAKKNTGSHILDGLIGILRWVGIGVEVIGTILATFLPGAQFLIPAITIAGSVFQQSLDTISFINDKRSTSRSVEFGMTSFLNVLSLGTALKGVYGSSRNVLRVVDSRTRDGVRYISRGSAEFNEAGRALLAGSRKTSNFKSIERISIGKEQKLIRDGLVKPYDQSKILNVFEKELQREFDDRFVADSRDVVSAGRYRYYEKKGMNVFSNRDLAVLRRNISLYSTGKITRNELIRGMKSLSSSSKESLMMSKFGRKWYFKNMEMEDSFMKRIDRLSSLYGKQYRAVVDIKPPTGLSKWVNSFMERLSNNKVWHYIGTQKIVINGEKRELGSGKWLTQTVQLSNPNDVARELENRVESFLLNGHKFERGPLKGVKINGIRYHLKQLRQFMKERFPQFEKVLQSGFKTRAYKMYKEIKEGLEKNGVKTKDDEFLMGWRVISHAKNFSEIVFYFNPINTRAITPGSKNYGGKKGIHTVLPNKHLEALKNSSNPGQMYLKGGNGYDAIALSPGGKRALEYELATDMFQLLTLHMPIEPLRNILSMVSNVKQTIVDVSRGTYAAKWMPTFRNTLTRLLPNKIAKITGNVLGGVIGNEFAGHLNRVLKGVAMGFERTTSHTYKVNGHRITDRKTTFSFSNAFKPNNLMRQALGQNLVSASLKRLPRTSIDTPSTTRNKIKTQRYGTQVRRLAGIYKIR